MAHCLVKRLYGRTNKHDDATKQIGQHVRRLERAQRAADQNKADNSDDLNGPGMMVQDIHHQISKSRNDPLNIYSYVRANEGDPALMVCRAFEYHFLCVDLT